MGALDRTEHHEQIVDAHNALRWSPTILALPASSSGRLGGLSLPYNHMGVPSRRMHREGPRTWLS